MPRRTESTLRCDKYVLFIRIVFCDIRWQCVAFWNEVKYVRCPAVWTVNTTTQKINKWEMFHGTFIKNVPFPLIRMKICTFLNAFSIHHSVCQSLIFPCAQLCISIFWHTLDPISLDKLTRKTQQTNKQTSKQTKIFPFFLSFSNGKSSSTRMAIQSRYWLKCGHFHFRLDIFVNSEQCDFFFEY